MRLSIRHKFTIFIVLTVVFLYVFLSFLSERFNFVRARDKQISFVQSREKTAIVTVEQWILKKIDIVKQIALVLGQKDLHEGSYEKLLKDLAKDKGLENGIYVGLSDGTFISSIGWVPEDDFVVTKRPWYRTVVDKKGASVVLSYFDKMTGKQAMSFSCPIFSEKEFSFEGVVSFDIYIDELTDIVNQIFDGKIRKLKNLRMKDGSLGVLLLPKEISQEQAFRISEELSSMFIPSQTNGSFSVGEHTVVFGHLLSIDALFLYPINIKEISLGVLKETLLYMGGAFFILSLIVFILWIGIRKYVRRIEYLDNMAAKMSSGDFDLRIEKQDEDELGDLANSFNILADDIKKQTAQIKRTTDEKISMQKELDIAREVQQNALPDKMPVCNNIDIFAETVPAKFVGGDYYDFIYPHKDRVGVAIADASGKGLLAALYMSDARSAFRVFSKEEEHPSAVLTHVNSALTDECKQENMFITYIYGIYDCVNRTFIYSNAGHFPAFLYKAEERTVYDMNIFGVPVGIVKDYIYREESVQLALDDIIVLYTDGVTEAINSFGQMYGEDRLKKAIIKYAKRSAKEIIEAVKEEVRDFVQEQGPSDDMTLLIIKVQ